MTIILSEQPFQYMVAKLWEFEGWRCLWRLPVAALLYALPALIFVGATVLAAFITGDDFDLQTAVVAAIVGAGATALLAPRLAAWRLHRKVIADRLWTFERPNPATEVPVLVRAPDEDVLRTALRRARFNPNHSRSIGTPPVDAPELDHHVGVHEPEAWPQSASDEDRTRRIAAVVEAAGIRARVGGIDFGSS